MKKKNKRNKSKSKITEKQSNNKEVSFSYVSYQMTNSNVKISNFFFGWNNSHCTSSNGQNWNFVFFPFLAVSNMWEPHWFLRISEIFTIFLSILMLFQPKCCSLNTSTHILTLYFHIRVLCISFYIYRVVE